jgi:hypothetical protein
MIQLDHTFTGRMHSQELATHVSETIVHKTNKICGTKQWKVRSISRIEKMISATIQDGRKHDV